MSHQPHRRAFLIIELATPLLLAVGLGVFTKSFFLSRTPFRLRSPCDIGSAGDLLSDTLGISQSQVDFLRARGFLSDYEFDGSGGAGALHHGCWAPRRVDSMAVMVVDAMRFDFARDHLPKSIGSRLYPSNVTHAAELRGKSKLFQFVADPPTVTMQRLKGLTTGGLPTFADITGSFGGATLDEDSWIEQLVRVPWQRRRYDQSSRIVHKPQIAFVGDDTWIDLFPTQFDDAHPYPSFNTRDLDTVDNGCLLHLPRLMGRFIGLKTDTQLLQMSPDSPLELIVAHFVSFFPCCYVEYPSTYLHSQGATFDICSSALTTLDTRMDRTMRTWTKNCIRWTTSYQTPWTQLTMLQANLVRHYSSLETMG